jgi:hypothetical protein
MCIRPGTAGTASPATGRSAPLTVAPQHAWMQSNRDPPARRQAAGARPGSVSVPLRPADA